MQDDLVEPWPSDAHGAEWMRLLPLPRHGRRFPRARNWLELSPADGLTATWHSEGDGPSARLSIAPADARTSLSAS
jgi:hypothetical protein